MLSLPENGSSGFVGTRHTSIVCVAERAAYRSVGSHVSQQLPAAVKEEGVWLGHSQPCAGSRAGSEEGK